MDVNDFGRVTITQEEYYSFHSIDRLLYATLVNTLSRDPVEATKMMAVWMWLERVLMNPNITRKIVSLYAKLIIKTGDEALLFWNFIENTNLLKTSSFIEIPLTCMILKKKITIEFLQMYYQNAIVGINKVMNTVCANCLKDIRDRAIERNSHAAFLQSVAHLGFVANNEMDGQERVAPPQRAVIHPNHRTLFVTFSNGYPVAEWELRGLFDRLFGDCIKSFYMQNVEPGEQAMFATIVFEHPSYIDLILGGRSIQKTIINGKHVRMRKFIPPTRSNATRWGH